MGVTLLLRQAIAPFLAVLALWFLWLAWRRGWLRRAIGPLAAAALVDGAAAAPLRGAQLPRLSAWSACPTPTSASPSPGPTIPIYGTQFEAVLSPEHGISYQELIPPELRGLNDALLDRALLDRGGAEIVLDDPGRYLLLSLSRIPIYFQFWPQSSLLSNAARLLSFGLFLPFMLYGLILAIRAVRPGGLYGHLHPGPTRCIPICAWPIWFLFCSSWLSTQSSIWCRGPMCAIDCLLTLS